ncbi:methylthioadenosine phosphorylase [Spongiibacter sp. IMCC21906]|uniref:S-methyl-5'-thioinosine phosphorylase n=1 Tax=Spongiibacter sp. IMCC21906 TaxID=1620392 RepID=UPI00062DFE0E|nr:S-methyl-5'-thioinosine phosphorylase [Spongiibacter sp. IMCC21906]AKH69728.1 methylthioadenosine phosphorylase [Spongiibacter sp. IMCC21906]
MRHKVAVVGGTGLCDWPGLEFGKARKINTPYGSPSAELQALRYQGVEFLFLPRHGGKHSIPPHKINYRANLYALHSLGVKQVLAVNAVGGIGTRYGAEVIAVPDQINDYTWGREHTYFDGEDGQVEHIDFSYPYSQPLRERLLAAGLTAEIPMVDGGVYAATQGPRLETAAEIRRLAKDGNDLVGMTGMPEAALARELAMDYASLCLVVNPAAGESDELITMDDITLVLNTGMEKVKTILAGAICALAKMD